MDGVEITLRNYRCFADTDPARFTIVNGFTSFVGVNNAGKSTAIRFLYEFRDLFSRLASEDSLRAWLVRTSAYSLQPTITDPMEVFNNVTRRDIVIDFGGQVTRPLKSNTITYSRIRLEVTITRGGNSGSAKLFLDGRSALGIVDTAPGIRRNGDTAEVDITELQEQLRSLASTVYIGAFRNAINVGRAGQYFDIHCGEQFVEFWRNMLSGPGRDANAAASQLVDDIKSILGFKTLNVLPSHDGQTLQFMIDGRSFRLTEVGAGLSQFVLVLANAAFKDADFVLIDEPELSLHPTLQIDFLTTLASYAKRGVLFSTHSYGLARSVSEQIYSVHRIEQGRSALRLWGATPNYAELLGSLSYSGYQELGFSGVLLVEGTTEVRTVQQFLRLYGKDHQVVLVPLGGSSMIRGDIEQPTPRATSNQTLTQRKRPTCANGESDRADPV